jgi:aldose sugar dehydrogenase
MRVPVVTLLLAAATAGLLPTVPAASAQETVVGEFPSEYQRLRLVRVAGGLENPWAVAPLPDGRLLVTERPGRLQLVADGLRSEVSGVPQVHAFRQGGLLDVVLHPQYASNGWVYLTYSKGGPDGTVTALARGRLDGTRLVDVQELFETNRVGEPGRHYGSRIVFLPDGTLLMTRGDGGANPERAQDTGDHAGTVLRLNDDGTVPPDNPYVGNPAFAPETYTYGNRNIQGMVRHPATGDVWATDHGPRGSDRLDRLVPAENYGWPVVSRGRDYRTQAQWGEGRDRPAYRSPVWEFLPTLAPSGLAVVTGGGWPEQWQGNLLAGGLRAQRIIRMVVEDDVVLHAEELLTQRIGRIRDVRQGPDGAIYIVTDEEDGGVYRLEPAT